MSAFDLIKKLRGAGVVVRAEGGVLDISPADRLTDEMIEALKRHKPEILALLKSESGQLLMNSEQLKPLPDRQKWKPDRCNRCIHISRFAGGNVCLTDNEQALLYGFSHEVPDDNGATCTSWQADRWELIQPTEWMQCKRPAAPS